MESNKIYPRTGDTQTVYLKSVITRPNIEVGDFTIYNDFVNDPREFEKNNVLYHYPINHDRLIIGKFCSIACGAKFIFNCANHTLKSLSTYTFPLFFEEWDLPKSEVATYGDLLTVKGEPQSYIIDSDEAPGLVTARDPESGEEFVIFDGGRHGYDNMFCDEHDPSELEHRPLKRYEIPASKLVLELGYSVDYEDEKEDFEPDEADTVELINGERMPWEQVKRDGIDYIALYYVNEKGRPVQILDAELA